MGQRERRKFVYDCTNTFNALKQAGLFAQMNSRKAFALSFSVLLLGAGIIDPAGTKHRFENICIGNIHDYQQPILPINLHYFRLSAKAYASSQTNMAPTAPTAAPVKAHFPYPV